MAKEETNVNKEILCKSIRNKHEEWSKYKKQCTIIREALEMNKVWFKNACKDPDVSLDTCKRFYKKIEEYKRNLKYYTRLCKSAKESWKNIISIWAILEKHGYLNEDNK